MGKFFSSQPLMELPLCLGPSGESSKILEIWFMVLIHKGVAFVISNLLRGVLDPFNPLGTL